MSDPVADWLAEQPDRDRAERAADYELAIEDLKSALVREEQARREGAESCAAGPWIEGPPPEVEGLLVLAEDVTGDYEAGETYEYQAPLVQSDKPSEASLAFYPAPIWYVGAYPYDVITRHAVINPPPPRGKEVKP